MGDMSKRRKRSRSARDAPAQLRGAQTGGVMLASSDAWKALCGDGYRPLSACPEVQMCVNVYAQMIASMTIHLMRNTEKGDVRIKNGLSRKVDIEPNRRMVHQTFFEVIVRAMMLSGNQVTVPTYRGGLLDELIPVPPRMVSFVDDGDDYRIMIGGAAFSPDEVLHFAYNADPDRPYIGRAVTVHLGDVVKSLRQADGTKRALMENPAPSIIVKVDGYDEKLKTLEGRDELAEKFVTQSKKGRPWLLQADAFSVEQVKPLSITDLAIRDNLELDKRSVAAMIGVTPYMVGIGEYKEDAHRDFVSTRLMGVARIIEQTMTKGLLTSPDLYWRMNNRSLMNYDIEKLVNAGKEMVDRMALRRNEWRDWIGLPPDEDMDELLALENYIPADKLGDQKKLNGAGGEET